jgi:Fe-S cluster assembly iron-binding protein IscA
VIRRKLMLTVSDKAAEVIKDFLKDKDESMAIRITLSIG